ncbi:hypothetical protein SNOG_08897 [Parastagonospora nodorum SN15]|uniref:Uncharacterized protein n=1 Tax=Phaeosphaeria nodorum (strain SN15 / ATCC MYA-4574 / FGSC 10173) TaxID=321614 RepID=Q0UH67_PHANO|nr:hypothetical protein SNOG_08897 [Parastagonospora nodorum SN15]EAT84065.1 hypothetical protein SNOG_08897 [Parastagonospora nodorum SN15]
MLLEPINSHLGALSICLGTSHEPVTAERRGSDQGFVMLKHCLLVRKAAQCCLRPSSCPPQPDQDSPHATGSRGNVMDVPVDLPTPAAEHHKPALRPSSAR